MARADNHEVSIHGVNICGVLVHARPDKAGAIEAQLAELPGVEVYASSDSGRIVVTVEDVQASMAGDTLVRINNLDGVLSASIVYHHCE